MAFARAALLTLSGVVVFGITMTFAGLLPATAQCAARAALLILLGASWWAIRPEGRYGKFRPVFFAYFAIAAALTLSYYVSGPLAALLQFPDNTPPANAIDKFVTAMLAVFTIIALTKLSGHSLSSLHIRKGRLLYGLSLGLLGLAVFVVATFIPGGPFFKSASTAVGAAKLMAVTPWVALFVFSNAFMEELVFRGILLERYEPLMGKGLALFSTTLVFALAHVQVTYAAHVWFFVAFVFVLGLLWGLLMQKSKSIWGSVLFHAGADVAVILPIYLAMI